MMAKHRLPQGLVQVYTGDGKGKTTAAFGLALRASGHGLKVIIVQFMKEGGPLTTGESIAYKNLPGVELHRFGRSFIFPPKPSKEEVAEGVGRGLEFSRKVMQDDVCDLLILDELMVALFFEVATVEQVLELIELKPAHMELLMTGRRAPQAILDRADLVSEMNLIKHPYDRGVVARPGIEY